MKFSVSVETKDRNLHNVVEKAVTEYLWLHQNDYVGSKVEVITVNVKVDVTDRPVDQGVS